MSSSAWAKSMGAMRSGHGGGRTTSCASVRWRSMSSISRRCVSRLMACRAIASAPAGGSSSADDQVRRDAALVEGVEHPDLDGTVARAARQDECGTRAGHAERPSISLAYWSDKRSSASRVAL